MKNKFFIVLIVLIVLAIIGVSGFFIWESQKPIKIKVAIREAHSYPFFVAEDKGFFKEKNIEIERVNAPSGILQSKDLSKKNDYIKWFNEGNADIAVLSADELFNMEIEYPNSAKAFLFFSDTENKYSASIIVSKDSDIKDISGLRNKKIAAESDVDHFLLSRFMKESGVDNFLARKISNDSWDENLKDGKIDAVWAYEPYVSRLVNSGAAKKLVENPNNNPKSEVSGSVANVIVARSDFINKNSKVVERFTNAIGKILEVSESEIRDITSKRFKDNNEVLEAVKDRTYPLMQKSGEVDKAFFQKIADMMFEEKYISKKVETSKLIY